MEAYRNSIQLRGVHAVLCSEHHQWVAAMVEGRFSWDNTFIGADVGDMG